MKLVASLAVCILLSVGGTFGQTTSYRLNVVEDVTLERGTTNFNYLPYLIAGPHPGSSNLKKRSLLRFQNVPYGCGYVSRAIMYIYYMQSHNDSFYSVTQAPFITRTIRAHRVLKSWKETQATSTKRDSYNNWHTPWLGLNNIDASLYSIGQTTIYPSTPSGFVRTDVYSAVRDWKNGSPNYGLVIWATNEDGEGHDTRFASNAISYSPHDAYIIVICEGNNSGAPLPTP